MNIKAQEVYLQRKYTYAKIGILVALIAGASSAWQAVIMSKAQSMSPFADAAYTLGILFVVSLVAGGLCDIFASLWLLIVNIASGRGLREYGRLFRTKIGRMIIIGAVCGGPIATGCYMIAINLAGPTYAAAIASINPILGTFFGVIFLKEKLNKRIWFGIVIAVTGALVVGYAPPSADAYPYFSIGIIFAVITAVFWALEGVLVTYANDMADPRVSVGVYRTFISGMVYLLVLVPIVSIFFKTGTIGWTIFTGAFSAGMPVFWIAIAAIGAATTYTSFYTAMNMTGVGRAMALNTTMSLWSIIFGISLEALGIIDYSITTQAIIGVFIIIVGTTLVVANPKELLQLREEVE